MNTKPEQQEDRRARTWFKKGQSGNPGGRPKGLSITAIIRKELEKKVKGADERTYKQLFAQSLIRHAISGHSMAISQILDRVDGKVKEKIEAEVTNKLSIELLKQIRKDAKIDVPNSWSSSKATEKS